MTEDSGYSSSLQQALQSLPGLNRLACPPELCIGARSKRAATEQQALQALPELHRLLAGPSTTQPRSFGGWETGIYKRGSPLTPSSVLTLLVLQGAISALAMWWDD